jgi:hypothetical protein
MVKQSAGTPFSNKLHRLGTILSPRPYVTILDADVRECSENWTANTRLSTASSTLYEFAVPFFLHRAHRTQNIGVAGAATEITGEVLADFAVGWIGIFIEQRFH